MKFYEIINQVQEEKNFVNCRPLAKARNCLHREKTANKTPPERGGEM